MFSDAYKTIERKYEEKRNLAEKEFKLQKENAYNQMPRLAEIDKEIAIAGIKCSKMAISSGSASEKESLIQNLKTNIELLTTEKNKLLEELNVNSCPNYECKKCNDTGFIITPSGSQMCTCFKQELLNESYNKSNLFKLKDDRFESFDPNLFSDNIDIKKYGVGISPRQNIERIRQIAQKFIENFDSPIQKNLLFIGTPGIGKTFTSSCIANAILKEGKTVLYQTAPLLLDCIFEYKYNDKSAKSKEIYDNLFNVDLLIIDDLGTENLTSAKFTEIFTVLNSRILNSNTKTIISTNLSLEELAKNYDDRILSRLIGNFDICKFFGEDIRLKKA